jgi:drug/metabolite transporter (DMT)-like permease
MATTTSTETLADASVKPNPEAHRWLVVFCFGAIYLIWGSTFLAIRYAVENLPALYVVGFRHLCAGLILLVWALGKGARPTWVQIRASAVIGFLFFLVGHGTLHWAEKFVPSGLAALLIAVEPIFVFLMSSAAARVWRLNGMLVAGILIGLGGVALLVRGSTLDGGSKLTIGVIAILVGAISWAAGIIYSRRSKLSGSPLLLSALSLLSGAVMLFVAGTVFGEWKSLTLEHVGMRGWVSIGYLILFGSVVTFTAYNWLLEHFSPTLVATHTYVNPVVAVLLGWAYGGEALTTRVGAAAAMVIAAVVLVDRGTNRLRGPA